jgi:hypothetical protein
MAEREISRGMLYSPSRTTDVAVVVMVCEVVLTSIMYSVTGAVSGGSQEMVIEKFPVFKPFIRAITLDRGGGGLAIKMTRCLSFRNIAQETLVPLTVSSTITSSVEVKSTEELSLLIFSTATRVRL